MWRARQVPEFGRSAAVKVVEDMKITSQNDKEKLALAKEKVYKLVRACVRACVRGGGSWS
jgi:hypothetical protein